MNKGGFLEKSNRDNQKRNRKYQETTGFQLTKSGRQRKSWQIVTGGGCAITTLCAFIAISLFSIMTLSIFL